MLKIAKMSLILLLITFAGGTTLTMNRQYIQTEYGPMFQNVLEFEIKPKKISINKPTQQLFDAIESGDIQGVRSSLQNGAGVNTYNYVRHINTGEAFTPFGALLHYYQNNKDNATTREIAKILLENKDLDINKNYKILSPSIPTKYPSLQPSGSILFQLIDNYDPLNYSLLKLILEKKKIDFNVVDFTRKTLLEKLRASLQQAKENHLKDQERWARMYIQELEKAQNFQ